MTRLVHDIMTTRVLTIDVDMRTDDALQHLHDYKLRCVPVLDAARKVFGVLNSKDIECLCVTRQNKKASRVWEICTPVVVSVSPTSPIRAAIDLMIEKAVHHILVLEGEQLRGIISTLDILKSIGGNQGASRTLIS